MAELPKERPKNEIDILLDIKAIIEKSLPDAKRALKNNNMARTRLRKNLQLVRLLSRQVRFMLQERRKAIVKKRRAKTKKK